MYLQKIILFLFPSNEISTDSLPIGNPDYDFPQIEETVKLCLKFNGINEKGLFNSDFNPTKVEILNYHNSLKKLECIHSNYTEKNIIESFAKMKSKKPNLTSSCFATIFTGLEDLNQDDTN
ncbi:hypothetical protein [Chryseobacterium indoltheticum]|uniref:Uncharacterized protein n=1 Tax=Chryseobacterium indoltheticum TaxID=254 RepID=A0A381FKZ4_9FLAO|nr:hypothetical protein [Chryseobacterium indoltheticum]SUX47185.1 Uncharacterised protein [Chryseobacterium indoltheticum]